MRKLRYRWSGDPAEGPMIGGYMLSERRPRGGYLILGVVDRGRRGGLGAPVHQLFVMTVERVTIETARQGPTWFMTWDGRATRR